MDLLCKTMGSDFKGFLGAILLESYSVHAIRGVGKTISRAEDD